MGLYTTHKTKMKFLHTLVLFALICIAGINARANYKTQPVNNEGWKVVLKKLATRGSAGNPCIEGECRKSPYNMFLPNLSPILTIILFLINPCTSIYGRPNLPQNINAWPHGIGAENSTDDPMCVKYFD